MWPYGRQTNALPKQTSLRVAHNDTNINNIIINDLKKLADKTVNTYTTNGLMEEPVLWQIGSTNTMYAWLKPYILAYLFLLLACPSRLLKDFPSADKAMS